MTRATKDANEREKTHRWRVPIPPLNTLPPNSILRTCRATQSGPQNTFLTPIEEEI